LRAKNRMREIRSSGSVRGGDGNTPAYSAERERRRPAGALRIGKAAVRGIAVGLQHPGIAPQQRFGVIAAASRRVGVYHHGRRSAPPRPVVAGENPEVTFLGAPAPGVEHRRRGLVDEQLGRAQQLITQQPPYGFDLGRGPRVRALRGPRTGSADPEGQCRPIDRDALPRQDLGLAIKRTVVGIFRHHDMGDQPLGRQAAFDQPRRCWRLDHRFLAGAAGVFRAARDDNPVLCRDDVEPLRAILPDHMHRAAAARAGGVFRRDDDLDPR
jgi:hypothetical protein